MSEKSESYSVVVPKKWQEDYQDLTISPEKADEIQRPEPWADLSKLDPEELLKIKDRLYGINEDGSKTQLSWEEIDSSVEETYGHSPQARKDYLKNPQEWEKFYLKPYRQQHKLEAIKDEPKGSSEEIASLRRDVHDLTLAVAGLAQFLADFSQNIEKGFQKLEEDRIPLEQLIKNDLGDMWVPMAKSTVQYRKPDGFISDSVQTVGNPYKKEDGQWYIKIKEDESEKEIPVKETFRVNDSPAPTQPPKGRVERSTRKDSRVNRGENIQELLVVRNGIVTEERESVLMPAAYSPESRSIWGPAAAVLAAGALAVAAGFGWANHHETEENEKAIAALPHSVAKQVKNELKNQESYVVIKGKRVKLDRYIARLLVSLEQKDKKREWRIGRDVVSSIVARINKLDQKMTRQHTHDHGHEMLAIHDNEFTNGKPNFYFKPIKNQTTQVKP